jgi:hypothetical protein
MVTRSACCEICKFRNQSKRFAVHKLLLPLPVLQRRNPAGFFKILGKVALVGKIHIIGYFRYGHIGVDEQPFGFQYHFVLKQFG